MRPENRIFVMRWAPLIGAPTSRRRVTVCHRAATLERALWVATYELGRDRSRAIPSSYWIVTAGMPATRR